jgi:hypothetical protein
MIRPRTWSSRWLLLLVTVAMASVNSPEGTVVPLMKMWPLTRLARPARMSSCPKSISPSRNLTSKPLATLQDPSIELEAVLAPVEAFHPRRSLKRVGTCPR